MIINPKLPTGNVVFCDDIREEIGGKLTYVGVYKSSLFISAVAPVALPQLCAAISLRVGPSQGPFSLTIRVLKSDNDEALFELKADIDNLIAPSEPSPFSDENTVPFFELFFPVRMPSVVINRDCAIKVRAYVGDDEIRLGAILVSFAELTNEQSLTSPN